MKRAVLLIIAALSLAAAAGCGISEKPVITSVSPQPVLQVLRNGETIFFVDAADPHDEPLTYHWAASAGAPASGTGSSFRWTSPGEIRSCTVSVTVSNAREQVSQTWEISVVEVLADMTSISGVICGSLQDTVVRNATLIAASGEHRFETRSDAHGAYVLQVPTGTYAVTAKMTSFNDATALVDATGSAPVVQDFTLTTGAGGGITFPIGTISVEGRTVPASFETRLIPRSSPAGYQCVGYIYLNLYPLNCPARGIRVYRSPSSGGVYALVNIISVDTSMGNISFTHSDADPEFSPGESVYYAFSAWGDSGESILTTPKNAAFLPELILTSPQNEASITSGVPITFEWTPLPGITASYFVSIHRWTGSNWTYVTDINAGSNTSQLTYSETLQAGTKYRWSVNAFASSGGDRSYSYWRVFNVVAGE